jgi:flagellar motor switch protein FliN/FliY
MAETSASSDVKAADFPELAPGPGGGKANLDLVRDIQVELSVELGRTQMLIQDIIELAPGKVIELDRLAGQPLDVLVNGKLLAKAEVVLVDDRYGVRITSIVEGRQREAALKA